MSGKDKICTVGGMRPYKLPGGLNLPKLIGRLEYEIRESIKRGYLIYETGMAMGADIWAAEIVMRLKREFPELRLVSVLPHETQANGWTDPGGRSISVYWPRQTR